MVRHDIVFIIRVDRLVLWRNVDLFGWKLETREVLEKVGVMRLVQVEEGE